MTTVKKPQAFKSIDVAGNMAAVAEFSKSQGVPRAPTVIPQEEKGPAAPAPKTLPKQPPAAQPSEEEVRLSVFVPRYVFEAINERAFQDTSSKRFIVLSALKKEGFLVKQADLKKDRRSSRD